MIERVLHLGTPFYTYRQFMLWYRQKQVLPVIKKLDENFPCSYLTIPVPFDVINVSIIRIPSRRIRFYCTLELVFHWRLRYFYEPLNRARDVIRNNECQEQFGSYKRRFPVYIFTVP